MIIITSPFPTSSTNNFQTPPLLLHFASHPPTPLTSLDPGDQDIQVSPTKKDRDKKRPAAMCKTFRQLLYCDVMGHSPVDSQTVGFQGSDLCRCGADTVEMIDPVRSAMYAAYCQQCIELSEPVEMALSPVLAPHQLEGLEEMESILESMQMSSPENLALSPAMQPQVMGELLMEENFEWLEDVDLAQVQQEILAGVLYDDAQVQLLGADVVANIGAMELNGEFSVKGFNEVVDGDMAGDSMMILW